jgi:hypothetical protein
MRRKSILILLTVLLVPTILKADGQDFLVYILDGFTFLLVVLIWIALFYLFLYIVKLLRKKDNRLTQKLIVGAMCLLFGIFNFIMFKSDPYPYEGPIDEFIHRDLIREGRIRDSLELWHGKPDSTIETTIAATDTSKIGVYIWLNNKSVFVRKLTPDLGSEKRNDSLTMSMVRGWKR